METLFSMGASRGTTAPGGDREPDSDDRRQFQAPDAPPHTDRARSQHQQPPSCVNRGCRSGAGHSRRRPGMTQNMPNNSETSRQVTIKATHIGRKAGSQALRHVYFTVDPGEFVAIEGLPVRANRRSFMCSVDLLRRPRAQTERSMLRDRHGQLRNCSFLPI